jgi:phosphinothricin acetyltransferase
VALRIADCTSQQAPEILAIFNEAIANSTALYDYQPRTMTTMEAWFEAKHKGNWPVLGAFEEDGSLAGFASFGPFRNWPAYKYSVEHSVYVQEGKRGRGLGRMLLTAVIEAAKQRDFHMMVGGIDSANTVSIRLHQSLGFTHCASIKHAGFKFGRWLDLEFYQLILPTPREPRDG